MSNIAVIGTGYVGLTTGAYLAHLGHHVVCGDIDAEKVARLQKGEVPILEQGLDELVAEGLEGGRLSFVVGAGEAVVEAEAEFVFLCVPTPQGDDGSADLSYIEAAAQAIGPVLMAESVVINKSTVPVGSTLVVERALGRGDVAVVSNPEFLREGSAVHDCLHPDRIVIGSEDQAAAIRVASLFSDIKAPVIVTDPASAETIKYASNAFLATKLSFVNAIANLCEAVGADVRDVVVGMGYDSRIGFEFLKPGPGWGGSCFDGEETLIARRDGAIRHCTFAELFEEVERVGPEGWEVYSWRPGEPWPEFLPVATFSVRPFDGEMIDIRTKMGRRLSVTADHPMVVGDGITVEPIGVKLAAELTDGDWLPVALGRPLELIDAPTEGSTLDALACEGLSSSDVIVRLSEAQLREVASRPGLEGERRRDVLRCGAMRLDELDRLGVSRRGGRFGTTTNGTYVPDEIPLDVFFWRMVGLYLAEGHTSRDGRRARLAWSFHHTNEEDLVEAVREYWDRLGVKVTVRSMTTARQVSISSRIVAAWFVQLGLGESCYDKAIPGIAFSMSDLHKRSLLAGLWDGDGSWSVLNNGRSIVLEYGTVSRRLADGIVRLLGDLGIVARVKVGRTKKSTVDTYWIVISGADQLEDALWLLPEDEQRDARAVMARLSRRPAPAGHRPLGKNNTWVRVVSAERRQFSGNVFSVHIPDSETVVTSFGLVAHQCFPKDSRALIRIAEDNGYDFSLLRGVIDVNEEQFERIVAKVVRHAGGSVDGKTVAAWGLTFKARTDDTRQSPALEVISRLRARGAKVRAYDPAVSGRIDGIEVCDDAYAAAEGADVLVVLTEWDEFRWVDFEKVAGVMNAPVMVDSRNLLDAAAVRRKGMTYEGLGRP